MLGPARARGLSADFRRRFAPDPAACVLTEVPQDDDSPNCVPHELPDLQAVLDWSSRFVEALQRSRRLGRSVSLRAGRPDRGGPAPPNQTRLEASTRGPGRTSVTFWYTSPTGDSRFVSESLAPGELSIEYRLPGENWEAAGSDEELPDGLRHLMDQGARAWVRQLPRNLVLSWERPSGARAATRVRIAYKQRRYVPV